MDTAACTFYTVGHSTRSFADFVRLLEAAAVKCVVDVRSVPRSRTNPQYNRDSLPQSLRAHGIDYRHIAALGGLRGRSREVPAGANAWWRNASFHNYADYTQSAAFAAGLDELLALGVRETCAVMCAEAVWWRCHRRIIADYLIQRGHTVYHLLGADRIERASQSVVARPDGQGRLLYPP
ncbi:MAG: DUF488 domain-containing protein [Halioglobus sp.]|nr:DUF488 domain-containing protein [Halioglobus sp.]